METVFLQILNMSITGSYIILAVMILRLFLKKAPKKYSYLMWTVCAFRLCCPVSFKNIFSIFCECMRCLGNQDISSWRLLIQVITYLTKTSHIM